MNRRNFFAVLAGAPAAVAGAVASAQLPEAAVFKMAGDATWLVPRADYVRLHVSPFGGSGGDPSILSGRGGAGGYGLRKPDGSPMFPENAVAARAAFEEIVASSLRSLDGAFEELYSLIDGVPDQILEFGGDERLPGSNGIDQGGIYDAATGER
jgi:hypothetical protein